MFKTIKNYIKPEPVEAKPFGVARVERVLGEFAEKRRELVEAVAEIEGDIENDRAIIETLQDAIESKTGIIESASKAIGFLSQVTGE